MKKALSIFSSAVILASCLSLSVSAAPEQNQEVKLPFDLTAPENVVVTKLAEGDSPNTLVVAYSQNTSMSKFTSDNNTNHEQWERTIHELGYDDLWINTQIDWSIDSENDWHYNKYWDTEGYDENYNLQLGDWAYISQSYGEETTMTEWIFRFGGDIENPDYTDWNGIHNDDADIDGWKDVLKEDQYDVIEEPDGTKTAKIDLSKHTVYTRVRWLVTCRPIDGSGDKKVASEWSKTAAIGKDAQETFEPLKAEDLKAPVVKDLKITDEEFNTFPVISFILEVPDELTAALTKIKALTGQGAGNIWIQTEARVQGKDEWVTLQGDWEIKAGENRMALQALAEHEGEITKETPIEIRCCYICDQNGYEEIRSDYSEILTFGSPDMKVESQTPPPESSAAEESQVSKTENSQTSQTNETKNSGFPVWIIILIIAIVLIIVIIIIILIVMKNKKKNN